MSRIVLLAAFLAALGPAAPRAQAQEARWEFGVSAGRMMPLFSTTFTSRFTAPWLYDPSNTADIEQTVRIRAEGALGIAARIGRLVSSRWGIELAVDHFEDVVSGRNPDYAVGLDYVSRQPPDYTPRSIQRAEHRSWPDTEGTASQTTVAAAVFYRAALSRSVFLDFSAGPALSWLTVEASSLGFSDYWFGGHSVVFSQDYALPYTLSASFVPGLRLACRLQVELTRGIRLGLEAVGLAAVRSGADFELRPPDPEAAALLHRTLDEIEKLMGPPKPFLAPSFARLSAGLTIAL